MNKFTLLMILVFLSACGNEGRTKKFHKAKEVEFAKFVNKKEMPRSPNLSLDKSIVNNDYPIEIALYEDHKFYYDLPNLGDGTGTWQYFDGHIVLKAKRTIFNMNIDVYGKDEKMEKVLIKFSDRHGPKELEAENINI